MNKVFKTSSVVKHVLPDDSNYIAYIGIDLKDATDFVNQNSSSIPKDERYDIYFRCEEVPLMALEDAIAVLPPLKKCPFCKSNASYDYVIDSVRVRCLNPDCRCQTPNFYYDEYPKWADCPGKKRMIEFGCRAAKIWNHREERT